MKPKEIKDFKTPSKENKEKDEVKSDIKSEEIFSYIKEKDNSIEKIETPNCRIIFVSKSKNSIIYPQIVEEKWINIAEINNFVKKDKGFWKLLQVKKEIK